MFYLVKTYEYFCFCRLYHFPTSSRQPYKVLSTVKQSFSPLLDLIFHHLSGRFIPRLPLLSLNPFTDTFRAH